MDVSPERMRTGRMAALSLIATLAVWAVFSWPLPRYVSRGIPASAHNAEQHNMRRMIAGDHLQLHYFYWLFTDMLFGPTPMWHNVYEFNAGDDAERKLVGNYSMPFTFLYAAGRLLGGAAFGWNLTAFLTLWATLLATWALIRRHTDDRWTSLLFALLALALPYRWIAMLGGSPTGLAMVWPPLLFLGLDMAGRDDSFKGSLLATLALALSFWNDPHTFFFSVLAVPPAYLAGFVRRERFPWQRPFGWGRILRGVAPVAAAVLALVAHGHMVKSATFTDTNMEAGRSVNEVFLFAPRLRGAIGWRANIVDFQIFIGYALPAALVLFLAVWLFRLRRRSGPERARQLLLLALLFGSLTAAVWLATGPHGPFGAVLFRASRKFLPGFAMIRQTAKIYALVPPLLALAAAVAAREWQGLFRRRAWAVAAVAVPVLAAMIEMRARAVDATVCLLDTEQPAYEAVHRDAEADESVARAHALVLPIWPGDSHWASLYQHYVSLYRIRMVSGYSPIVSREYRENVYERFQSGNAGLFEDDQLDDLLARGIHYVIFHEDAYPEQVGAYPAILTLRRLLNHERLAFLAQGESVWAFRIRPEPGPVSGLLPDGPYFPCYRWNGASCLIENGTAVSDATAWGGSYARVEAGGALAVPRPFNHQFAPDPRLWTRVRGHGSLQVTRVPDDPEPVAYRLESDGWDWIAVPLPDRHGETMTVRFEVVEGYAEFDMLLQAAGGWQLPEIGETVSFAGCLFFRSGYTDKRTGSVTFRPDTDAASRVLYGLRLPLAPGIYVVELDFASDAPPETRLGEFTVADGRSVSEPVAVVQGEPARILWDNADGLPLDFDFTYTRNGPIVIRAVELTLMNLP